MVDFHTHVLPRIDDGSGSTEESLSLLESLRSQGVDIVCATSHFYPAEQDPESFLRRRGKAWDRLRERLPDPAPRILLGAEVYYFDGISRMEDLSRLRLEGTDLLLLEMPFMKWSERMIDEILAINEQPDITVLLAHINRYMRWNRPDLWPYLRREGVLMQINTEFLLDRWKCRTACRMLDDGTVAVVGTDCHNTTSRPPRMAEAIRVLEKRLGEGAGAWLSEQSDRVLRDHRLTGAEAIGSGES